MESSKCITDELLPEWLTIGFTCCAFLVLLFVSIIALKEIKSTEKTHKTATTTTTTTRTTPPSSKVIDELTADKTLSQQQTASTASTANERGNDITLEIAGINSSVLSSPISSSNKGNEEKTGERKEQGTAQENTQRTQTISSSTSTHKVSAWHQATCGEIVILWAKEFWARKGIYTPIMAHVADTATDIAAAVQFAFIAASVTPQDCGGLDVWWLMVGSVVAMVVYRVISSLTIWRITRSIWRVMMQLMDVEIFHLVYFGHKMCLNGASSPQRLIAVLEAVFEAAPQSVFQMIYLVKTGSLSTIIVLSSALSLVNLTNTLIADDKKFLKMEFSWPWRNNDAEYEWNRGWWKFRRMLLLYAFRLCDIPGQILLFVMIWHYLSGYALTCVVAVDSVICGVLYRSTKNTDSLLSIIAIPWSFGGEHKKLLKRFWRWSVIRTIALNVTIWIIFQGDAALVICCSVTSGIRFIPFYIIWKYFGPFHGDDYMERTKERRGLNELLVGRYYEDAIELIFYVNFDLSTNANKLYGEGHHKQSLLAIAAGTGSCKLFEFVMEEGLDDIGDDKEEYWTGLIVAVRGRRNEFISAIFEAPTMNKQYLMRISPDSKMTALYFAIRDGFFHGDHETLEMFIKGMKRLSDDDIVEVLNNTDPKEHQTALHVVVVSGSLSVFKMLYECYPDEYKDAALRNKDEEGRDVVAKCHSLGEDGKEIKEFVLSVVAS